LRSAYTGRTQISFQSFSALSLDPTGYHRCNTSKSHYQKAKLLHCSHSRYKGPAIPQVISVVIGWSSSVKQITTLLHQKGALLERWLNNSH